MKAIAIIQVVSVLISIVAPIFFFKIVKEGIKRSNFGAKLKSKFSWILFSSMSFWVVIVYLLTLNHVFAYSVEDQFPKFLIGLLIPVTITLALMVNRNFRIILDNIPYKYLAGGQLWRILGAIFFLVATSGIGPKEFIGSGIGDVTTGLIAMVAVWSIAKGINWSKIAMWSLLVIGVADLLIVLFILLTKYPIWSDLEPSTAIAGSFPMMLIIGVAAPIALLLHIFMFRKMISKSETQQSINSNK